jgi:hypothetical protein
MSIEKSLSWLCIALLFVACSNDDSDSKLQPENDPEKQFASCAKADVEPDLVTSLELTGPGVNPTTRTLTPGNYHVATTYLALQPGKIDLALEHSGPVIEGLFELPGFVAVMISGSASCNTLRTLTLWASEEALFDFVASPAHIRAMAQTTNLSRGTSNTITWEGNAESATWREAARQLGLEVGGEI